MITEPLFRIVAIISFFLWFTYLIIWIAALTKPHFWISFKKHLSKRGLLYAWILSILATAGSLWLSEIAGFDPCSLCWYQRIMMYPLVIVLGVGLLKKKSVKLQGYILAGIGGLISTYHYLIHLTKDFSVQIPCTDAGACSITYHHYFGFYSIPLFALCAFVGILTFLYFYE